MPAPAARVAPSSSPPWLRLAELHADANTVLRAFEVLYPPVDIEALAHRMGIDVVDEPQGSEVSGRVDVDHSTMRAVIRVRRDHARWRQRFTIAHEIGHLVLHHTDDSRTCFRGFSDGPDEAAANRFAADLLMPLWMLEPLVVRHGADVTYLSRAFAVSEEAMQIRLGVLTGLRR